MRELSGSCLAGVGKLLVLGDAASGNIEAADESIGLGTAGVRRVDTSGKRLDHLVVATRINFAANSTTKTGVEHYVPK